MRRWLSNLDPILAMISFLAGMAIAGLLWR